MSRIARIFQLLQNWLRTGIVELTVSRLVIIIYNTFSCVVVTHSTSMHDQNLLVTIITELTVRYVDIIYGTFSCKVVIYSTSSHELTV